jgi:hypothetical protein
MADILRIKRRVSGSPGAPASLQNAELAYNEVDHTLYYGEGTGGAGGSASNVVPIGGQGLSYSGNPIMNGAAAAGAATQWSRGDHVHPSDTSRAPTASPTFSGVATFNGTITGPGVTSLFASPPPIGGTAPAGGAFTTLSATGSVTGAGFVNWAASPPAIGATAPSTGRFTTLTVDTALVGAGVTALLLPYAPLASPVFTGAPSLPVGAVAVTQANGTNNTTPATTAFVRQTRLDQLAVPTAAININSNYITNVLNPVNPQDVATKLYVDQNSAGLSAKTAVAIATTANLPALSGLLTIDGYTVIAGDRVLVKDQALPQNNGLYVAAAGAWARALDMDTWGEVPQAYVFVSGGAVNSASSWVCNSAGGGTLGTTPITWVQFSQQAQVSAGGGLTRTGNTFDVVGTAGRILVNADNIDIDAGYLGQTSITTLGTIATGVWNGTTIGVARGGTGATTLTGYVKGAGTGAMTASATIPNTDITGLGTMAIQNAAAVAITGGTIDNITLDGGTF